MSADAVRIASLETQLEASQRQVGRLLRALRLVARGTCFCGVYLTSMGAHSAACRAARAELQASHDKER